MKRKFRAKLSFDRDDCPKLSKDMKNSIKIDQGFACAVCEIRSWNAKPIIDIMEIHHMDGNPKNNKRENLAALCPNCHRQTENWGWKNTKFLINNKMPRNGPETGIGCIADIK